jgi:hypothetical protein
MSDLRQQALKELARRELNRRESNRLSNFKEEAHPDISFKDRAIVKNFSNNIDEQVNFLKKSNPNLDITKHNDRVLIRRPDEKEYRVLDPDADGFDGFKELAQDALDIGYDVGSGVVEGLATVGSAGLASGAAAGTSEYLRQKLGESIGANDGVDLADVATVAGASTLIPFGGKFISKAAKPAAKVASKAVNKTLSAIPGLDKNVIETMANRGDDLGRLANDGYTDLFEGIIDNTRTAERNAKERIGQLFDNIENSDSIVDLSNARNVYDDEIGRLDELILSGRANKNEIDLRKKLVKSRDNFFTGAGGREIQTDQSIRRAQDLKRQIGDAAGFDKFKSQQIGGKNANDLERLAREAYRQVNTSIDDVVGELGSKEARKEFSNLKRVTEFLGKKFKNPEAVQRALKAGGKGENKVLLEALKNYDEVYGTDLLGDVYLYQTARELEKGLSANSTRDFLKSVLLNPKAVNAVVNSPSKIDDSARNILRKRLVGEKGTVGNVGIEALKTGFDLNENR